MLYPTFDKIKYYGVVEFDTKDPKLLEFIVAIFETFSINYDNVFIIDINSAQNTLEYFRDNYDDEDE